MNDIDISELSRKDLNLLVVFDTVARTGSVTEAAERLCVTQSAVSHAVGRLRKMLDDPLFVRGRTGLSLTARAEQLVAPVREALLLLEGVLKPNGFEPATTSRTFRVGLCEYSMVLFSAAALSEARAMAPNVSLVLDLVDHRSERRVAEGGLDIALWPHYVPKTPVCSVELFSDRLVGVIHAAHPLAETAQAGTITVSDYLRYPHVQTVQHGAQHDEVGSALDALGLRREIAVSAATFAPSFPLLFNSQLIVTVPAAGAMAAAAVCRDLLIFELPFAVAPLPYRMVWHKRNEADPALAWLGGLLCDVIERILGKKFLRGDARKAGRDTFRALQMLPASLTPEGKSNGFAAR